MTRIKIIGLLFCFTIWLGSCSTSKQDVSHQDHHHSHHGNHSHSEDGEHTHSHSHSITQGSFSVTGGIVCNEKTNYKNDVKITTDEKRNLRIITSNAIPNHSTGTFPNAGNPNTIQPQNRRYEMPLQPKKANKTTPVYSLGMDKGTPAYIFGVAVNGIKMEPSAMEFFINPRTGEPNLNWTQEALSTETNLGDDCNNAHVQPNGEYHYHGTPWGIVNQADGKEMFLVGWAADGFPIYYKWGYQSANDAKNGLKELKSSYRLKKGNRPGDGITAPDGKYSGKYVADFEFVTDAGDLDECGGRYGTTPEFPNGTYYYVITDDFPSVPRCFAGTPDEGFKVRAGMGRMGRMPRGRRGNHRPNPTEIMNDLDANHDNKISKREAKGPLQRDFERVDKNKDGFITLNELKAGRR
jgi:hypothetical protein